MYDRFKPVEQELGEVEAWHRTGVPVVFFADDNFVGHRAYAKELLRELEKWNAKQSRPLSFYTQASIDMVRDQELLTLLRKANFNEVFVGIESPRKSSLAEARKTQNEKLDLVEAVHTIQSHNIFVVAGMTAGFDNDDPTIFDEQFDFCQEVVLLTPETDSLVRCGLTAGVPVDKNSIRAPARWIEKKRDN
jgi:radical SAM superfamily enzyme YgiQ (UPF0313 family)